ncbi:hypothetical protein [Dinghuibacter silviterrae]|uniref:Uncharacterized protein n=1 Tax=Dinghuibacter silviterrae TaxID=1539049 RepID=A0A4R8DY02_9BACT|nr:hypothetical protein [Dinghuibacter silviterrae]TDX02091.1 hypothetical protein EDB95_3141 [Dinghuibacter silviterrae]
MAWNQYYVFVKNPRQTDLSEILRALDLQEYKPSAEVDLYAANKAKTLFAGFYNGSLLFAHPKLPYAFFGLDTTDTERRFTTIFPDSDIAALVINESVNGFGYALITGGRKIRVKDGADGEIYHDMGDLLPEEKEVLSEEIYTKEELEDMKSDGMSKEEIQSRVQFEASFRVPNRLTRRFLGETVLKVDGEKVKLTMYSK